jgi:chitin disaccharide deacetylase
MKVVFHADDFGLTPAINDGILEACERGVLRSTSLMVTGEAAEQGIAAARATPGLDVGVHLTLVEERPVLPPDRIPSLVAGDRFLPTHAAVGARYLMGRWHPAEARAELAAQLERFTDSSLVPSHLDGHQHLHLLPGILPFVVAEAHRRNVRFVRTTLGDAASRPAQAARALTLHATNAVSWLAWLGVAAAECSDLVPFRTLGFLHAGGGMALPDLLAALDRTGRRSPEVVEVMLHPGRRDADTERRYGHWRYRWENDLALLLDPRLPDALARRGIEWTSFRALATAEPRS